MGSVADQRTRAGSHTLIALQAQQVARPSLDLSATWKREQLRSAEILESKRARRARARRGRPVSLTLALRAVPRLGAAMRENRTATVRRALLGKDRLLGTLPRPIHADGIDHHPLTRGAGR
jgi:hypothetical protein